MSPRPQNITRSNSSTWSVTTGHETQGLLEYVFSGSNKADIRAAITRSSASILGRCTNPSPLGTSETGLVVGYVQSGKTLSFTTVATLARDNGYHMVILLTGISNPLFNQSTGRIRHDLRLDLPRERRWSMFLNPKANNDLRSIGDILNDWQDETVPDDQRATALIPVMKNHTHLRHLTDLLRQLDLTKSPVLIIDDEADQASMNTRWEEGKESTTYRRIGEMRQCLPHHTFLQYTATPQAPLLISLIDTLSPNFVQVLEPGQGYIGGKEFFEDRITTHIKSIPSEELEVDPELDDIPPESLLDALRVFFIGVACGYINNNIRGNRSMLVHPSHLRDRHTVYFNWVNRVRTNWEQILANLRSAAAGEILDDFRSAYDEVKRTETGIPTFDKIQQVLPRAIRKTRVIVVNSSAGSTPSVPWNSAYAWILVAGQAVDRGFTVEGLTVTYMPRGIGVGNADTLQQRGRFFGYKQDYLGYCRVYLPNDVRDAFHNYVDHEEDVRGQLQEYQTPDKSLNEWKRAFILSPDLRPTRQSVLQLDYMHGLISNAWATPQFPLGTQDVQESNRWLVSNFINSLEFMPDDGHPSRTDTQLHLVAEDVRLETVLQDLLLNLRIPVSVDSQRHTGLMLQLRRALERNPDELCSVYQISARTVRHRTLNPEGRLSYLFQGAHPSTPKRLQGSIYPGDLKIHHPNRVSIQIHMLALSNDADQLLSPHPVPVIATWVPSRLGVGWIVEDEYSV